MRSLAIPLVLVSLAATGGCMTLHANLPEDAVREHVAREEGIDLASICSYQDARFSEGAVTCMAEKRMTCGPSGRWVEDGDC